MTGYMYVWQYEVPPERQAAFRQDYGPDGAWVQLFRRAPGYVRTELFRDRANPNRFLTLDFWESEEAFRQFKSRFADEYRAIDARCESLTTSESEVGRFEPVDPA